MTKKLLGVLLLGLFVKGDNSIPPGWRTVTFTLPKDYKVPDRYPIVIYDLVTGHSTMLQ